jgi:signal transduction histidine kinase
MDSMRKHLSREGVREHFSLNGVIADIVHVLSSYARTRHVSVRFEAAQEIGFYGDAVHFTQVLTNLISNAIESYPSQVDVSSENREVVVSLLRSGDHVEITVRDYGAGISEENLNRIFEPFFTTKGRVEGLGIGLSLAKRIIEKEFSGTLTVQSREGKGSAFVVRFPI